MSEGAVAPRRTKQRAAIGALMEDLADFRTAQQVHEALREAGDRVGLSTVYRTLQAMAESGEVDVIRTADGESAYRSCRIHGHHHHLVCRSCGRTVEISGPDVEDWAAEIGRQHGFRDIGHELELFGLCADCAAS
ncbi:Fur family transcriptional regulator [Granulicoccus phenolivorans]|uniref:Fur family transcriptional regulator n=1 Tax=Granulicoccus phenolivorans TaxID=266854 RepID=UPI00041A712B|nr:Fur family transcriptional regulator [Granulicoccus phenolivorans]